MVKEILLAEDDRGTALLVKVQLEKYGYRVTVAGNGFEALSLVHSRPVDLIITDVVMPEMDGVDLYLALKKDERTAGLPIIIITDKQMFKESFAALGVNHFVEKSSEISLLVAKIEEVGRAVPVARDFRKVLVAGSRSDVIDQIRGLLDGGDCLVTSVEKLAELSEKAFLMSPHVVLLDAGMKGVASPSEMIRSLRAFKFLKDTRIVTYVHLSPEDIGRGRAALEPLEEEVAACQQAGADRHLGRYNRVLFLEAFEELGLKARSLAAV
ncbi:MAG: response regulator [Candidatus Omnitrophota bacterium]